MRGWVRWLGSALLVGTLILGLNGVIRADDIGEPKIELRFRHTPPAAGGVGQEEGSVGLHRGTSGRRSWDSWLGLGFLAAGTVGLVRAASTRWAARMPWHGRAGLYFGAALKGFMKTAVLALAIMGVAVLAATLAPATIPYLAAVGIYLLLVGTGLAFVHRWQEQADNGMNPMPASTALVALGDVLGISPLIEGVTGRRLLTHRYLLTDQAGEALGVGLGSVFAWGVAVRGGLRYRKATPRRSAPSPDEPIAPDVGREAAVTLEGRAGVLPEAVKPRYTSEQIAQLPRFADEATNRLPKGLSLEDFHRLRLKPTETLTAEEVTLLKSVREAVPPVKADTIMQKTIQPDHISRYLDQESPWTEIRGFVTRAQDVSDLRTPAEIIEGLRLDYLNSPFSRARSVGVMRFRALDPEVYRVPYGGQNERGLAQMGGTTVQPRPFTGNGFTANETRVIPEYRVSDYAVLPDGAEMWEVLPDGTEVLRGVFNERLGRFVLVTR